MVDVEAPEVEVVDKGASAHAVFCVHSIARAKQTSLHETQNRIHDAEASPACPMDVPPFLHGIPSTVITRYIYG